MTKAQETIYLLPARVGEKPQQQPLPFPSGAEPDTTDVVKRVRNTNVGAFECAWYALDNVDAFHRASQGRKLREFDHFTRCLRVMVKNNNLKLSDILQALVDANAKQIHEAVA